MKNNPSIVKAIEAFAASLDEFGKARKHLLSAVKKGKPTKKIRTESATGQVYKIICQHDWIDYRSLLKESGFSEKKLQGIIFNLKRQERIEYRGRGVYKKKDD